MAKRRPSGDGMVRRREDGRWEGRIVVGHKENGDPIFHYLSVQTQKALLEKLHKLIDEYDGAELSEDCRMTLGEWLDIWLEECAAASVRPSTLRTYRRHVEKDIKPYLGSKQVSKLTTADVQKLYHELLSSGRKREHPKLGRQLSPASLHHIHGVLHQAMDVAVQRHLTVKNPTNGVTLPKRISAPQKILNGEQLERFLEVIQSDPIWHDFFYLDVTTGLRRGELCGLLWSDFDEVKGTLSVRRTLRTKLGGGVEVGETKTSTGKQVIQLPPSTAQLLRERKKNSISPGIFPNPLQPEQPVNPNNGYARLKSLLKEAELPNIRFHDLRHTFVTLSLEHGMDLKTLSTIIGHTSSATTLNVYTHITNDMQKNAAVSIDRGIAKAEVTESEVRAETPAPTFIPYKTPRRRPGTGCISQLNDHLWEGRYSPIWPDGKKHPRNIYAHTLEECEARLKEMIREVNGEIAEARHSAKNI